jgi:hypothetical protein
MSRSSRSEIDCSHEEASAAPRWLKQARVEITIGIDLGDVWSHYSTLNIDGEMVNREVVHRRTPARVAMEAGVHSIWISEQLQELGHEVIVDAGSNAGWDREESRCFTTT